MDIFLLEDDEAIGIGLTYSLENEGYNVTLAKSVKEAEKIIDEKEFSLYILDLTLPDGSGYDVCKRIKAKGDLPVIFLKIGLNFCSELGTIRYRLMFLSQRLKHSHNFYHLIHRRNLSWQ